MTNPKLSVLLPHTWGEVKNLVGAVAKRDLTVTLKIVSELFFRAMKLHKVTGHWRMTSCDMDFEVLPFTVWSCIDCLIS